MVILARSLWYIICSFLFLIVLQWFIMKGFVVELLIGCVVCNLNPICRYIFDFYLIIINGYL